jgi:hypothetical protein
MHQRKNSPCHFDSILYFRCPQLAKFRDKAAIHYDIFREKMPDKRKVEFPIIRLLKKVFKGMSSLPNITIANI